MVTQDQARACARHLYPELWSSDPVAAVAKAIDFLFEAANDAPIEPPKLPHKNSTAKPHSMSGVVRSLADQMSRHRLHVNVVARAIGVSGYTVRTWLEGKYVPNETNSDRIAKFIENLGTTPEILTSDS